MKDAKTKSPSSLEPRSAWSRRDFFYWLWLLLGGVVLAELVWMVADFLLPRRSSAKTPRRRDLFVAGPVERFGVNSVTPFPQGKFYLVRLDGGGFLALRRECTHLGCTVPWDDETKRFVCPCHASSFDIRGAVLSPPASRPLDLLSVRIENNVVKVDLRQTVKRRGFSPSQVVRS